jgi:peptidoglycan hydrolase CwlO-like protein
MNKNAFYVLFLIVIVYVNCSGRRLEKLLDDFVELEKIQKKAPTPGVLLAQIRNAFENQSKANKDFHRTLKTHCTSANTKIQNSINSLTQAITESQNNLNNHKNQLTKSQTSAKDAAGNIKTARAQYKDLQKRLDKTLLDYKVVAQEANQKLSVVKLLRDIISDELLNNAPGSFVQLNKFQEKLNELKGMLNNNNDSIYAPIVSVLLDLATEQNFSNQSILKQILVNINNLDKALKEFRKRQEAGLDTETKSIRAQMKNTVARIQAYSKMRAQARSNALDAQHYIKFYTHEIEHFNAEKGRKTEEQKMFTKLCTFQKSTRKNFKARSERFWKSVQSKLPNNFMALEK